MDRTTVFVTGATGFVGRHLLKRLAKDTRFSLRILSRSQPDQPNLDAIQYVQGDLRNPEDIEAFVSGPGILVHLAYLENESGEQNEAIAQNLVRACTKAGVRRIVHCSTAVVAGQSHANTITESTPSEPLTDYELKKAKIESVFMDAALPASASAPQIDVFVLRPTAVFGPGGKNALKLIEDRRTNSAIKNFVLDCLYGDRRLNLVSVNYVVEALAYFAALEIPKTSTRPVREIILLSSDENPENNYRYLMAQTQKRFAIREWPLPPLPLHRLLLPLLLRLTGRSNNNPYRNYISKHIAGWGFQYPRSFKDDLDLFLDWLKNQDEEAKSR